MSEKNEEVKTGSQGEVEKSALEAVKPTFGQMLDSMMGNSEESDEEKARHAKLENDPTNQIKCHKLILELMRVTKEALKDGLPDSFLEGIMRAASQYFAQVHFHAEKKGVSYLEELEYLEGDLGRFVVLMEKGIKPKPCKICDKVMDYNQEKEEYSCPVCEAGKNEFPASKDFSVAKAIEAAILKGFIQCDHCKARMDFSENKLAFCCGFCGSEVSADEFHAEKLAAAEKKPEFNHDCSKVVDTDSVRDKKTPEARVEEVAKPLRCEKCDAFMAYSIATDKFWCSVCDMDEAPEDLQENKPVKEGESSADKDQKPSD
jgi:hypothetical protein